MPTRRPIPQTIQELVRERAGYLCEYCHTSELWQCVRFTIDHIIPLAMGGSNLLENFALACFHCNRKKYVNRSGLDPLSGKETRLFNPRRDIWNDHFSLSADRCSLVSQTSVGRTTIVVLELNRSRILAIRASDVVIGRHPPIEDLILK
jgi:5-methylcytosine-specific restriction endonuclease McrA